jgi:hypothetical protein
LLRKFVLPVAFVSLALIAAFTLGCGSSSKTTTITCDTVFNVVGDWQVTVSTTGGGSVSGYGAIDSSGLALFFDTDAVDDDSGDTLELPTLTGNCSFSGNLTAYAEPGGLDSGSVVSVAASGNVTSNTSITGTFSGSSSGTISATAFSPLTGSPTALTGALNGEVEGAINGQPILLPLVFSQSGSNQSMSFTTNSNLSPNCSVTGTFTQVATNNVFDVSMTFTGTDCALTGTFTGLGFESGTDYFNFNNQATGTYLYADILDSTDTFVMEIY